LALMVYKTHKVIWALDMEQKRASSGKSATDVSG
jgi:hypothetical protein